MTSNFLIEIEKIALSLEDLKKMNPNTNVIIYNDLQNINNIREVMKNGTVIILLQIQRPDAPTVGHWIAILDHGSHIEHFDSYGFSVDEEISLTQESHKLTELLKNEKVDNNTQKLQARREGVNTCGRWCILRTLLKNMGLKDFVTFVTQCQIPDYVAAYTTMFLDPNHNFTKKHI